MPGSSLPKPSGQFNHLRTKTEPIPNRPHTLSSGSGPNVGQLPIYNLQKKTDFGQVRLAAINAVSNSPQLVLGEFIRQYGAGKREAQQEDGKKEKKEDGKKENKEDGKKEKKKGARRISSNKATLGEQQQRKSRTSSSGVALTKTGKPREFTDEDPTAPFLDGPWSHLINREYMDPTPAFSSQTIFNWLDSYATLLEPKLPYGWTEGKEVDSIRFTYLNGPIADFLQVVIVNRMANTRLPLELSHMEDNETMTKLGIINEIAQALYEFLKQPVLKYDLSQSIRRLLQYQKLVQKYQEDGNAIMVIYPILLQDPILVMLFDTPYARAGEMVYTYYDAIWSSYLMLNGGAKDEFVAHGVGTLIGLMQVAIAKFGGDSLS